MKLFARILLIVVLISVTGCATGPFKAFIADKDPFSPDKTHYFSSTLEIKDVQFLSSGFAFFRIHCVQSNSGKLWYLETTYSSKDWLFVKDFKFVADGVVFEFPSQANPKREVGYLGGTDVFEVNTFVVPESFLVSLKSANSIILRLTGDHYYIERTMTPDDIFNIGWFYDYVQSVLPAGK